MSATSPRERLYAVFADGGRDVEEKITRALEVGASALDLPIGFFTRIDGDTQRIVHAVGDHERIRAGETCPLEEAYCRYTLESDGPLAVQDAAASSIDRRAVEAFDLGSYMGATVTVDDETYGTVCFAGHDARDGAFSESDELFLELLANLVSSALERRAYERTLRERTERLEREKGRFEGIAETSFDILFRVGLDARFTYVSAAVERVLDYRPEELTGESFTSFMTDEAAEAAAGAYERVLAGEAVENLELDFRGRDGEVVVVAVNATPITDDGEVTGIQGVGRDVTGRKDRERELRVKTRAMDEAAVGISIADPEKPDTPLRYVNDGFERITGYDAEAALGRNCRFLQGERTDEEALAELRAAVDGEESETVDLVNYRRDGTPFWNRVRINPIFDEAGELTHYLGFQDDVTDRKRTEQLIRLLNRVLRHNLRNEMTLFLAWGSTLRRGDGDPRELGERIERAARELVDVSEHARELERDARRDRRPRRLDVNALLADVMDEQGERAADADVDVRVETERAACAGAEVREALSELVENALKHNPAETPRVSVSAVDAGECVEIAVADDGPGIDPMEAEVIASGEETALMHGSGLGLWLVNWIVTRYGGSFQISADDGNDTSGGGEADATNDGDEADATNDGDEADATNDGDEADATNDGDEADDVGGTTATVRLPAVGDETRVEDAERGPTVLFF